MLQNGAIKGKPTRPLPHAKNAARSNNVFFLCWVDYAREGSTVNVILAGILAACFTLRGHDTYRFTVVIVSGRQDLPSDQGLNEAYGIRDHSAGIWDHKL